MTIDFPESSYPIVSFLSGDQVYNPTYGYHVRQNPALMKENLTPLGENRSLSFEIQCFHKTVSGISLEVRTVDGSRLIEDSEVKDFEKTGDVISVYTSLKDLLKNGCEYALTVRLDVEGEELYYNTRVVPKEEVDVKTYLDFTKDFTYRTFGEKEEYTELKKYLESNSSEDNADFGYANIHSSLEQVTWGTLAVNPESDIYARLLTIEKDSATVIQYYIVQIGEGKSAEHYRIEEYFRVRRGSERMHLIEYERSMSRLIFEEDEIFFNDTLFLGIDDGSLNMKESPEGTILAFVKDESLFVSNPSENKFAKAFSYYNKENYKDRPFLNRSEIQILSVEEDGKTTFASYGYMTRGSHEGETGLLIYVFDFEKNTLEEKLFMPYSGSPEMLHSNLSKLLYLNAAGSLFFFRPDQIHAVVGRDIFLEAVVIRPCRLTAPGAAVHTGEIRRPRLRSGAVVFGPQIAVQSLKVDNRFALTVVPIVARGHIVVAFGQMRMPLGGIHRMRVHMTERGRLRAGIPDHVHFAGADAVAESHGVAGAFLMCGHRMGIGVVLAEVFRQILIRIVDGVPLGVFVLIRVVVNFLAECPDGWIGAVARDPVAGELLEIGLRFVRKVRHGDLLGAEIALEFRLCPAAVGADQRRHAAKRPKILGVGVGQTGVGNDFKLLVHVMEAFHIGVVHTVNDVGLVGTGLTLPDGEALRHAFVTDRLNHIIRFVAKLPVGIAEVIERSTVVIGQILFTVAGRDKAALVDFQIAAVGFAVYGCRATVQRGVVLV